jgi:hypothetical protein
MRGSVLLWPVSSSVHPERGKTEHLALSNVSLHAPALAVSLGAIGRHGPRPGLADFQQPRSDTGLHRREGSVSNVSHENSQGRLAQKRQKHVRDAQRENGQQRRICACVSARACGRTTNRITKRVRWRAAYLNQADGELGRRKRLGEPRSQKPNEVEAAPNLVVHLSVVLVRWPRHQRWCRAFFGSPRLCEFAPVRLEDLAHFAEHKVFDIIDQSLEEDRVFFELTALHRHFLVLREWLLGLRLPPNRFCPCV